LQTGEHIVSIAAGDTLRWQVSKTHSGMGARRNEHLLIKPTDADLTNTLVITTDKRTYHLSLHSEDKTYMASVEWRYPQGDNGFVQTFKNDDSDATNNIISQGVNLNQLNFKYRTQLTGGLQPGWMPEMVFNDGNKVYIEFPQKMQEAPTLFVGNAPENDKIVNYRVEGNYYIVDGLPLEFQLRSGQKKPTVVQITYVGK
jgi:type IV secretion system protein VirB9